MDVATRVFGIYLALMTPLIGWLLMRRLDQLPTREEVSARFDAHDKRIDRLEAETATLRSDLTQIALAVGARTRPQTG